MNVMCLSARKESAWNNMINKFKIFLETQEDVGLENVLYTLHTGRKSYEYRWAAVCETKEEYIRALARGDLRNVKIGKGVKPNSNVIFAFAGQGSQYPGMGKLLYQNNRLYKRYFDECAEIVLPILKEDIRTILFEQDNEAMLAQTQITQPVIFSVEYALAKTLMDMGIFPKAMLGHSLGEYTAACIAGVFCLKDALRIVCRRGEMMQTCETGAMLSVKLSDKELKNRLLNDIEIAAINAIDLCVLAGKKGDIKRQQQLLEEEGIECKTLSTSHGFHSKLVEPALEKLRKELENTKLNQPQIPFVSNLTGTWIEGGQAADVNYWLSHARNVVKFMEASECILHTMKAAVILEIGPGRTMTSLIRKAVNWTDKNRTALFLMNSKEDSEEKQFYNGLMELWVNGVDINWNLYYKDKGMKKVPLPAYCFERDSYILRTKYQKVSIPDKKAELTELTETGDNTFEHDRSTVSAIYEEPKGEIEIKLTQFLEKLLGINNIGRYDNFFELGGNSMIATQVISWINNQYPVQVTMSRFFEKATVCELAEVINELLVELVDTLSLEELNRMMG